jgi:hypothetical protein
VAQDLLNDADVDALLDEERSGGMPGVVEASVSDSGLLEDGLPLSSVFGAADRAAVLLAEDQVVVLPSRRRPWPVRGAAPPGALEQRQEFLRALEGEL